jgi:succinoglycan biosynthesis transport protein ExoP
VAQQLQLVDDQKFFALFGVSDKDPAFQLVDGRYASTGRATRQRVAGEVLLDHLGIEPARLSRLVDIRFTSPDANLSAKVANAWAENFIQTNLDRKIQATSYGRNVLQRQLAQLKERLDQSQRQLVGYASAQRIINLPPQSGGDGKVTSERSIVADNLAALNTVLSQATADRIQAEARYQQAGRSGASTEALGNQAINGLRQKRAELAADYQRLMIQFEPDYPAAKAIKTQLNQPPR